VTNVNKSVPLDRSESVPLTLVGQCFPKGRYTISKEFDEFAISKYRKTGKGITFASLLSSGLAYNKKQAQTTLKYYLKKELLFTLGSCRPQEYFPRSIRSEIIKNEMSKKNNNIPISPTGVGYFKTPLSNHLESIIIQTLEGYVLPLLPTAPLYIHNMHFKLAITPECYNELDLPLDKVNKGKEHNEIIGKVRISYRFYANGTIMVSTESSNNPFKLEDGIDRGRLMAFFGQMRDRLITLLMDRHERLVPDIMDWELTQCDINKDIIVSDWFQFTGMKIQVKHLDNLFRIYIKSMGKDTVCRVEESCNQNKPAIQAINEIFNPFNRFENQITEIGRKIDRIYSVINIDDGSKDLTTTTSDANNSSDVRCQQV
jgi:hypothetical protein